MFELYQVGLAFIALLIGLIVWAAVVWSTRAKTQGSSLISPTKIDFEDRGSRGFYVATTFADRPLDRISAHGLGFAGKATVNVTSQGVEVFRTGESSFQISRNSLVDLARSSVVIDKAVERDGLLSLRWRLGQVEVDSHFRFANSAQRNQIAHDIANLLVGVK